MFVDKIAILIDGMERDDNLSVAEKESLLKQLKVLLSDIESEYQKNVEKAQKEIDYSPEQRFTEMSEAKKRLSEST